MNKEGIKYSKRNSCLLITAVILILLFVFAYVANKEVSNAFKLAEEGLIENNQTLVKSNEALKNVLISHSDYGETVKELEVISSKYNTLLDSIIEQLIIQTGGWKVGTDSNELANPKNRGVPTRILVTNKLGNKLEQVILETSVKYNEILKVNLKVDTIQLPLKLNKILKKNSDKTWVEYNFNQMPLMAVLPILRKFKNDENESKAIIYRYMAIEK